MARQGIPVGAPIEYPTLTIKDRTYTLKLSFGAEFMLDQMGIKLKEDWKRVFSNPNGPGKLAMFVKVLSAMAAHNFVDAEEPIRTPEQWAHLITSTEEFLAVVEAVKEALLKAAPPAETQLREPAAKTIPGLQ